jgi:hypothetical protein
MQLSWTEQITRWYANFVGQIEPRWPRSLNMYNNLLNKWLELHEKIISEK